MADGKQEVGVLTDDAPPRAALGASTFASLGFVASVGLASVLGGSAALAIYVLSFWHYYLYWLAYRFGAARPDVFRRDAVLMKSVSLVALGYAYFEAPFDPVSLAVIAAGFALNISAACALGSDRTYYGHELAGLPRAKITAFPYGWVSHPMLVGNIAAFGGTLLNEAFRQHWWPLACAHVVLNFGLLVMELHVKPLRRAALPRTKLEPGFARRRLLPTAAGLAGMGAAAGALAAQWLPMSVGAAVTAPVGAFACLYAFVMFRWYEWPRGRA